MTKTQKPMTLLSFFNDLYVPMRLRGRSDNTVRLYGADLLFRPEVVAKRHTSELDAGQIPTMPEVDAILALPAWGQPEFHTVVVYLRSLGIPIPRIAELSGWTRKKVANRAFGHAVIDADFTTAIKGLFAKGGAP